MSGFFGGGELNRDYLYQGFTQAEIDADMARLKAEADAELTRTKKAEIEGAQTQAQGMRGRGQTILTGRGA